MSSKHRTYPELPLLLVQTPDGRKEQLQPTLCAEQAAEFSLTLSLGVDGDIITHHYTLGLTRMVSFNGKYAVSNETMEKILEEYSERVRGRIKLDAVLQGSDLWLRTATFRFPQCEPLVVVEPEETWMKMVSGQIRPDLVHVKMEGSERIRDDT